MRLLAPEEVKEEKDKLIEERRRIVNKLACEETRLARKVNELRDELVRLQKEKL